MASILPVTGMSLTLNGGLGLEIHRNNQSGIQKPELTS